MNIYFYRIAKLNELARTLKGWNSPTHGELPYEFWRSCSDNDYVKGEIAFKLYRKAGYEPFAGYPLRRLENANN